MNSLSDNALMKVDGHVLIKDADSGDVLLDKHNAINFHNMAIAIASMLAGQNDVETGLNFNITKMAFGNGGTVIDGVGNVLYKTPNVDSVDATLYNKTYEKDVTSLTDLDNTIQVVIYEGATYTDVKVFATMDYEEPSDDYANETTNPDDPNAVQNEFDTSATFQEAYVFDEIGLITESGKYLSHIIFHPIEKAKNRRIQVIYTLRIKAGCN